MEVALQESVVVVVVVVIDTTIQTREKARLERTTKTTRQIDRRIDDAPKFPCSSFVAKSENDSYVAMCLNE